MTLGLEDGWGDLIEKAIEHKAIKERPIEQTNPIKVEIVNEGITA
jgi:hypothetical protein